MKRAIQQEAWTRTALLVAVIYGEHGYAERPSEDQVIDAFLRMANHMDWAAYNRAHGAPDFDQALANANEALKGMGTGRFRTG